MKYILIYSELTVIILTPILTLLANYIFYKFVKAEIDKKIHQNNIAYSGVFQEKIKVYRELLEITYDLRLQIHIYLTSENQKNAKTTSILILEFAKFYNINRPFLLESMYQDIRKLRETFTLLYQMHYKNLADDKERIDMIPILKEFNTETLEKIEKKLVSEMKKQLNTL